MTIELLKRMGLGKLLPTRKPELPDNSKDGFRLEANRMYMLVGGVESEIATNCDKCGNGYRGHRDQMCQSCSTPRKVFYLDVTELENYQPGNKQESYQLVIPKFTEGKVNMGEKSKTNFLIGKTINIGYECSADILLADSLSTWYSFDSKLIVAKDISIKGTSRIECIIVRKGGSLDLGPYSHLGLLIVEGPIKNIYIQNGSTVDKALHVGIPQNLSLGTSTTMTENKIISLPEYSQILKEVTKLLPSY